MKEISFVMKLFHFVAVLALFDVVVRMSERLKSGYTLHDGFPWNSAFTYCLIALCLIAIIFSSVRIVLYHSADSRSLRLIAIVVGTISASALAICTNASVALELVVFLLPHVPLLFLRVKSTSGTP
jgi:hypothetical protein